MPIGGRHEEERGKRNKLYDSRKNGWDRCEEHDAERRGTPASYREVSTLHKKTEISS